MQDPKRKFNNSGESFEADVAALYDIPSKEETDEVEDDKEAEE